MDQTQVNVNIRTHPNKLRCAVISTLAMIYFIICNALMMNKYPEVYIHENDIKMLVSKILILLLVIGCDYQTIDRKNNDYIFSSIIYLYTIIIGLFYIIFQGVYTLSHLSTVTTSKISRLILFEFINNLLFLYNTILYFNCIILANGHQVNDDTVSPFIKKTCICCRCIYSIFEYFVNNVFIFIKKLTPTKCNKISNIDNSTHSDIICAICKNKIIDIEHLRELDCSHKYHNDCIDIWLQVNPTCPMCRVTQL